MDEPVDVLGVPVHPVTLAEKHREMLRLVETHAHAIVAHVNVHAVNLSFRYPWLFDFWRSAAIVYCDGFGVRMGARLLGHRLPPRITYADAIWNLAELARDHGLRLYFLAGRPGVAAKAAQRLTDRFPGLQVVGTHHGYFDKSPGSSENEAVLVEINALAPNILIVGFGMPLQEQWLTANWPSIRADLALTNGAVFDFVSGELRRAPKWMTDHGLEWLGRLLFEPRRLWKRYLLGNPEFLFRILKKKQRRE